MGVGVGVGVGVDEGLLSAGGVEDLPAGMEVDVFSAGGVLVLWSPPPKMPF